MTISLTALRTFATVARLGKFSAAAKELHLTPPALSRHVKLIESQLGLPVFERLPGGVQVTEAGKIFSKYVDTTLASLQDGLEAVQAFQKGGKGIVKLCLPGTLCNDTFLNVLRDFKARNREAEVSLQMLVNAEVSEVVSRGEANLGIQYQEDRHPHLKTENIGHETVVVVCAPQHPLARARSVHARDLANETWIGTPIALTDLENAYQRYLARFGLAGSKIIVAQSYAIRNRLIEANLGIGIAVRSIVQKSIASGSLCQIKVLSMRSKTSIILVRRKSAYLNPTTMAFADYLRRAFLPNSSTRR